MFFGEASVKPFSSFWMLPWIVEVLCIFGLYRLLPCCYDKMSNKKHLERKDLSLPALDVFVCSDIELQSIAEASLLLKLLRDSADTF